MTVSFLRPTPFAQYAEFFNSGRRFIAYTDDHEEIEFVVIDPSKFVINFNGVMCIFDPISWLIITDISVLCQIDEIIPSNMVY